MLEEVYSEPVGSSSQLAFAHCLNKSFSHVCSDDCVLCNAIHQTFNQTHSTPFPSQVKSFKSNVKPAEVFSVPILEQGKECLAAMNTVSLCLLPHPCQTDIALIHSLHEQGTCSTKQRDTSHNKHTSSFLCSKRVAFLLQIIRSPFAFRTWAWPSMTGIWSTTTTFLWRT